MLPCPTCPCYQSAHSQTCYARAQVPGSLLGLLFDPVNAQHLAVDQAGRVFFDYDPAAFALVLRYLRELKVTGGACVYEWQANFDEKNTERCDQRVRIDLIYVSSC